MSGARPVIGGCVRERHRGQGPRWYNGAPIRPWMSNAHQEERQMNVRRVGLAGAVAVVVALGTVVAACGQATAPASQVKVEPALEVSGQSPTSAPLSSDVTSPVTITGMTTDTGGLALTGNLTGTAGLTTTVALTPTELLTTTLDAATFDLLGNLTYTLDGQDFALVNGIFGN